MRKYPLVTLAFVLAILPTLYVTLQRAPSGEQTQPALTPQKEQQPTPAASSLKPNNTNTPSLPSAPQPNSNHPLEPNASPRNWNAAITLVETVEEPPPASRDPILRHRIVQDDGFDFPIRITDAVVYDETGAPQKISELTAYAANQILLHSPSTLAREEIEDITLSLGWTYLQAQSTEHIAVLQAKDFHLDTVEDAIAALALSETPYHAEPNHIFYASKTPNDPRFSSKGQWGLAQDSDFDIDAPEAWDKRTSTASVTIAIIDSGIRLDHEDLKTNLWRNSKDSSRNRKDEDNNGYVDDVHGINIIDTSAPPEDDNGHGTHVAGIAGAAGNNSRGISGVAWDTQLMAIKALNSDGRGTASNMVKAIDYAINSGADVINASWGSDSYSDAIDSAIRRARDKDILVVAAAGNDGYSYPDYPANSTLENVVSVGSASSQGVRSLFTNRSSTEVDVMAPGNGILSTWHESADAYSQQNGTSMAAPVVSGILALCIAEYPNDDYDTHKQRLIVSSVKRDSLAFHCVSGGLVNLNNALRMDHVPVPPVLLSTSSTDMAVYEGESLHLWAQAESELPLRYKWLHNGSELSETSSELTIDSIPASGTGTYVLEIINDDATISAVFEVTVHARMPEIEELIGYGAEVYSSQTGHWELFEEGDTTYLANEEITSYQTAFLEFRIPEPGLLRLRGKRSDNTTHHHTFYVAGPSTYQQISETDWTTADVYSDYEVGFTATIELRNHYSSENTPARFGTFEIPTFYEHGKHPPVFYEHIYPRKLTIGSSYTMEIYSSQEDLTYQWYKDDAPIDGATESRLEITISSKEDEGYYYAVVSNEYGSLETRKALIEVDDSPQPASAKFEGDHYIDLLAGEPFILPMSVFGAEPITYQWYRNHQPIPGANSPTLNLGPTSMAHTGRYHLTVENELNHYPFESSSIYINVHEQILPPKFSPNDKKTQNYVIAEGQDLNAHVGRPNGSNPIDYLWYKDGEPLEENGEGSGLNIYPVSEEHAGTYYLEASNSLGSDQSGRIHLSVTPQLSEAIDMDEMEFMSDYPKQSRWQYLIFQQHTTFDGEDAAELYLQEESWINFGFYNVEVDTVLKIRWLHTGEGASTLSYFDTGRNKTALPNSDSWQEKVIYLPAHHNLEFHFATTDSEAKAWFDAFEILKEPFLVEQIKFDLPEVGKKVELSAKILATDASYQWYKNDEPIPDATDATYTIDSFAETDAGDYHLVAQNEFGEVVTKKSRVELNLLDAVIKDGLNVAQSEGVRTRIALSDTDPPSPILAFEPDIRKTWSLETQVTGPAVFSITYEADWGDEILLLNDQVVIDDYSNGLKTTSHFVPEGTHSLKLEFTPWSSNLETQIHKIALKNQPLITLDYSWDYHFGEYGLPYAKFSGIPPLTLNWYKDGQKISTQTNLQPGAAYPYDRETNELDQAHYQAEIIDRNGKSTLSETFYFYLGQYLRDVLDSDEQLGVWLYDGGYSDRYHDDTIKLEGLSSLALQGPFKTDDNATLRIDGSSYYAKINVRSQGFPPGSSIEYHTEDGFQSIPANDDWQEIEMRVYDSTFALRLPEGDENSILWIDKIEQIDRAVFRTKPQNIATYLGADVSFVAEAVSFFDGRLQLHWEKEGEPISGGDREQLKIESVSKEDLGEYRVSALSPNGETIFSDPFTLTLVDPELAKAIGYPGANITTTGRNPWQVDYEKSLDGPSSIISGELEEEESTTIRIQIDGPVAWGLYTYRSSDTNIDQYLEDRWEYHSAYPEWETGEQAITQVVYDYRHYGPKTNRRLRLDGVKLTRFSDLQYDRWIDERLATATLPQTNSDRMSDLDGDGIPNWLEFTLNLDPLTRDTIPTFGVSDALNGGQEAAIRFFAARSSEYSVSYEISEDLKTWATIQPELEIVHSSKHYDELTARFYFQPETSSPYFIRWTIHHRTENNQDTF
ncbi:S8 family serine peptidase [Pelagicoccus mobilis]|uniref:S8 family serine peptidase n=1 Tax=Pelagicoccus mobilis TaxID=415221 RepID=A0A934RZ55_9BACT|nr:S8 family serine peptidase [Pelagicoccus mobilis]MBK1876987.1 S8 family serine peptidase [Pelagicoccus mobilis]